jgi:transposase-like protein
MVAEVRGDYRTESAAINAVVAKLGIGSRETLRKRVRQDRIDSGQRPGTTAEESEQIRAMKKEIAELKRANETSHALLVSSSLGSSMVAAMPRHTTTRGCPASATTLMWRGKPLITGGFGKTHRMLGGLRLGLRLRLDGGVQGLGALGSGVSHGRALR